MFRDFETLLFKGRICFLSPETQYVQAVCCSSERLASSIETLKACTCVSHDHLGDDQKVSQLQELSSGTPLAKAADGVILDVQGNLALEWRV